MVKIIKTREVSDRMFKFVSKWNPDHPEITKKKLNRQSNIHFSVMKDRNIIGYMNLIPDGKVGWGATITLDMSLGGLERWFTSRKMLGACRDTGLLYAACGLTDGIIKPYQNWGLKIHYDWANWYMRPLKMKKIREYLGKPWYYTPAMYLANAWYHRDNYWQKYHRPILTRLSIKPTTNLKLFRILEDGYSETMIHMAIIGAENSGADGIVAIDTPERKDVYKNAGMWASKPFPIAADPKIKKLKINLLTADMDNLW